MLMDPRVNTPISTAELERRWRATRMAMADAGIDVLLMQANNDFMGGYVKWFTDLPATQGYAEIVTFPRDDGMTTISQGAFGHDARVPPGGDGVRRGISRTMTAAIYASATYCHAYDAALTATALAPYADGRSGNATKSKAPPVRSFLRHKAQARWPSARRHRRGNR